MQPTSVLATLSGRDRPGITAAFFSALAAHDVEIRDVEQVVIRDRLILAVLFDLRGDTAPLRNSVTRAAGALGMEIEVAIADHGEARKPVHGSCSHVMVIGRPLRPGALSHVAQRIADVGANIESVTQLSTEPASSLAMAVRCADPVALRASLVQAADDTGVDIAVEADGSRRLAKRLVLLDIDSTLVRDEAIDALAARAGVAAEVAAVTAQELAGELDFAESLRARATLLAGLAGAELDEVRDTLRLTPVAGTFIRALHRVGYRVGVVSRGFTFVTDRFVTELGLDFAAANQLEVVDGVVTGRLVGALLDRPGKAAALARFAEEFGVPLAQTVAVGDGADDIDMLGAAGLGVACNARSVLRAAGDTAVTLPYLETVLSVLGLSSTDLQDAADRPG